MAAIPIGVIPVGVIPVDVTPASELAAKNPNGPIATIKLQKVKVLTNVIGGPYMYCWFVSNQPPVDLHNEHMLFSRLEMTGAGFIQIRFSKPTWAK